MAYTRAVGFLLFAAAGALVTTFCDGIHVHTRTLSYPAPFIYGQAWWVYPGFVLAFLFMEGVYFFTVDRLPEIVSRRESLSRGSARETVETAMVFALVYLLSGFGNYEPVLLSFIFYGAFILRLVFTYERILLLLTAILMAIGGMFVEGAMSAAGLVTYRHADVFNVPFWLGGLYVHGAFGLREGMRYFVYNVNRS